VVARYVESGRTQRDFAREEGIGVSTLQLWLREVSANEDGPRGQGSRLRTGPRKVEPLALLEVELEDGRGRCRREAAGYEVALPGGTQLRFGAGFVEAEVRRLLALLKEVD